jgi:LAO/AO transport system kinase
LPLIPYYILIYHLQLAGYSAVIVESVGLGQSEVEVDSAVDMLVLVLPPGAGDGLQASKKGIMEAADLFVVNKADGNLLASARHTKADYSGAVSFIRPKYPNWQPEVMLASAATDMGIDEVEGKIEEFHRIMVKSGILRRKRATQLAHWMTEHMKKQIVTSLEEDQESQRLAGALKAELISGKTTARAAARRVVDQFLYSKGIIH